jgi:uncharacterized protein YjeT (DUF2065 family)
MTPEDVLRLATQAAAQSDRALFLFAIIVLVIGAGASVIYLVRWLRALITELQKDNERTVTVIETNTAALTRIQKYIENH